MSKSNPSTNNYTPACLVPPCSNMWILPTHLWILPAHLRILLHSKLLPLSSKLSARRAGLTLLWNLKNSPYGL